MRTAQIVVAIVWGLSAVGTVIVMALDTRRAAIRAANQLIEDHPSLRMESDIQEIERWMSEQWEGQR